MSVSHVLFVTTSASAVKPIAIKSPMFDNMGMIPKKYTADGANINPPLLFNNIPDGTQSMVLMVEDPNAPVDTWVHWLVWDIFPTGKINENSVPGTEGLNAFEQHRYHGPCPPADLRYYQFKIYALNTVLRMHCHCGKYEIMKAMKDHVIGYGELTGTYTRHAAIVSQGYAIPDTYA